MKQLAEGVWSVMLTSFNDDKSIDYDGMRSLVDFYIDNGCDGLFAACSSSEVLYLEFDEIVKLCRETVKYAAGRAQVVGGAICHKPLEQQAELIKMMLDTGIDVPIITTNQIGNQGDSSQTWMDNIKRLLDMTDCPLGMYESPFPYKRLLGLEEMKFICDSGRFVFHKDTCCNAEMIKDKVEVSKGTPLSFYNANVDTLVSSLNDGAYGYCGTAANFYPDVMKYICDNFDKDDFVEQAEKFIISGEAAFCNTYPLSGKYFLKQRGVNMHLNCRVESSPLQNNDIVMLDKLMKDMNCVLDKLMAPAI